MKHEYATLASALYDGELESHEIDRAIRESLNERTRWETYALIGDALRGSSIHPPDLTTSVMARLYEEPVVLAPRNLKPQSRQHPLLALAASVAGVTVVGWLALGGSWGGSAVINTADVSPAGQVRFTAAVAPAPTLANIATTRSEAELNEYLLAHHAQAATVHVGESAKQIRTVAMTVVHP